MQLLAGVAYQLDAMRLQKIPSEELVKLLPTSVIKLLTASQDYHAASSVIAKDGTG